MPSDAPVPGRYPARLLHAAAVFAGAAPSIHNSQPWEWQVAGPVLDLMLARERVRDRADPLAGLAVLSCGTALHHAVARLAADGWRATVRRLPDYRRPDHLARLELARRIPADPATARRVAAAARRRTDRRPMPRTPLDVHRLRPIVLAARRHGAELRPLRPEQNCALAAAFDDAARAQGTAEDRGRWAGGIPAGAQPDAAPPLGEAGPPPGEAGPPPGEAGPPPGGTGNAVFAVLYGTGNDRADWLRAGEALSAAWLTATALDVAVLPLSAVIEVVTAREAVRRLLGRPGRPYLVLRFAAADPGAVPQPPTPRLPADATVRSVGPRRTGP
ncbi:nitroreductase [Jidongwangia harbinensis]|uniref:nitroreductase n=1 Tax=Jidongwangia harbinensis TaxID=2878561 RepID=UPI001CD956DB|nr:nitroreductase [Jidongwangia harbinensis]MCA2213976.1 nitroreductase [Jidongwangia harbinensis]